MTEVFKTTKCPDCGEMAYGEVMIGNDNDGWDKTGEFKCEECEFNPSENCVPLSKEEHIKYHYEQHDCHLSEDDGCGVCEEYFTFQESVESDMENEKEYKKSRI